MHGLMFDHKFNLSLEGIQLPNSRQSSMLDYVFIQSIEGIQLPGSLQSHCRV